MADWGMWSREEPYPVSADPVPYAALPGRLSTSRGVTGRSSHGGPGGPFLSDRQTGPGKLDMPLPIGTRFWAGRLLH